MQKLGEFEFSRDGLISCLRELVRPLILQDEVIKTIEKKLPYSIMKRSVNRGIVGESDVFKLVERYAKTLVEIEYKKSRRLPRALMTKEVTVKDALVAFDELRDNCPFCL
jgi:hypothetical protein